MESQHAVEHGRHALLARPLTDLGVVLQDQRHADGRDQRCQARGVTQRFISDALDGPAVHPRHHDGEDQRAEDQQRKRFQPEEGEERQADSAEIGGDHIHFAVGEVNHADNTVNHGVADGYQSVDRPQR